MKSDTSLGKKDLFELREFSATKMEEILRNYDGGFTPISENNMDYPDEFDISNLETSRPEISEVVNMIALSDKEFVETLFAFSPEELNVFSKIGSVLEKITDAKSFLAQKYISERSSSLSS